METDNNADAMVSHNGSIVGQKIPVKKNRNVLTLSRKAEIIGLLKEGQTYGVISKRFHVARSTITGIRKQEDRIFAKLGSKDFRKQMKTLKAPYLTPMEDQLYDWIMEQTEKNNVLSIREVAKKAKEIYKSVKGHDLNFRASNGWVHKFKMRYGIKSFRDLVKQKLISNDPVNQLLDDLNSTNEESNGNNTKDIEKTLSFNLTSAPMCSENLTIETNELQSESSSINSVQQMNIKQEKNDDNLGIQESIKWEPAVVETNSTNNSNNTSIDMDNSQTEIFAKNLAFQMKDLDPFQRIVAEKLISDVIFYGRLAQLTPNAIILPDSKNPHG